jgi:nucleotide-binding universal stress UspA family protein|tara:strand:+ start:244 stop:720 length:477 start_codon:yes stop_codon:yes gene_type:complete
MSDQPRKFLVVADASEECHSALYFAARRAVATEGLLTILAVLEPSNFDHWIGVSETMRREAEESATQLMESLAEEAEGITGVRPEMLLREGDRRECLSQLVEEDEAIALLVLGASESGEGPGPLVSALARGKGLFGSRPIPITVVPGGLSYEAIDAMT